MKLEDGYLFLIVLFVQDVGPVLSQTEYRKFILDSVIQETHDSYRFKFKLPNRTTLGLKTGQHIVIR